LDVFDTIEICMQADMAPSQKSEWCWHAYDRYFKLYAQLIKQAHEDNLNAKEDVTGLYVALAYGFPYQWSKRSKVLNKGGLHDAKPSLQAIESYLCEGLFEWANQFREAIRNPGRGVIPVAVQAKLWPNIEGE
jgi:hypothetical protein